MLSIPAYPFWSVTLLAIDELVIDRFECGGVMSSGSGFLHMGIA
jgi:hypothetical protein